MEEQKTEAPEPSALEKIQMEYNHVVGLLGHNIAQQITLKEEEDRLRGRVSKLIHKAANLPKGKEASTPSLETTTPEELKNGTSN